MYELINSLLIRRLAAAALATLSLSCHSCPDLAVISPPLRVAAQLATVAVDETLPAEARATARSKLPEAFSNLADSVRQAIELAADEDRRAVLRLLQSAVALIFAAVR